MPASLPYARASMSILLACMLVSAAFLFCYRIGDKPLDFDERYSVNIATGFGGSPKEFRSFGQFTAEPLPASVFHATDFRQRASVKNVAAAAMNDNGQGLPYFILLHYWLKLFGISAISARLLSALLMLVSLALLHRVLHRLAVPASTSMLAITLFACNGVIIGLAQYARFYSLGLLLCIVSLQLLLSLNEERSTTRQFFAVGIVWALFFLCQYFSVFVIVPELFLLLTLCSGRLNKRTALALAGGCLLPVIIWLWPLRGWVSLTNIYALHHDNWQAMLSLTTEASPANLAVAVLSAWSGALGQPVNFLHGNQSALLQIAPALPALFLAAIAVWKLQRNRWVLLCAGVFAAYTLGAITHALMTRHTLLFQVRYWVFAYVFSYLLLAYSWPSVFGSTRAIRALCMVALLLTLGRAAYTSASAISGLTLTSRGKIAPLTQPPLEDYEATASAITREARQGDTVSYRDWKIAQIVNWYLSDKPDLIQRVDSGQLSLIMLCHDAGRQDTVLIPRGAGLHARAPWRRTTQ